MCTTSLLKGLGVGNDTLGPSVCGRSLRGHKVAGPHLWVVVVVAAVAVAFVGGKRGL
jgi:hypothetical protein